MTSKNVARLVLLPLALVMWAVVIVGYMAQIRNADAPRVVDERVLRDANGEHQVTVRTTASADVVLWKYIPLLGSFDAPLLTSA